MIIAFWSTLHGQTASSNLLSLAVTAANKNIKTFIMQTHYNMNYLDVSLIGKITEKDFFIDTGIDALIRCMKSAPLTEETIRNCTISLLKDKLDILVGTRQHNRTIYQEEMKQLIYGILSEIEKYYDIVFVDTNSGMDTVTRNVLEKADVIAFNTKQNMFLIDDFFEMEYPVDKNKLFYLFGAYDEESRYTIKNMRRKYKEIRQSNSSEIPYNIEFSDSFSDGSLLKYMCRNIGDSEDNAAYRFFCCIEEAFKKMVRKAGVHKKERV